MARRIRIGLVVLILHTVRVGPAFAQADPPDARQASIGIDGGLAAASRGNGASLGGRLAFDLTDRFVVEADGLYIGGGRGTDAFSASASLVVNLVSRTRKTVPYLAGGGGLYHAAFDLDHDPFFGRLNGEYPAGTQLIPIEGLHGFGMMQGPYTGPPTWTGAWPGRTYTPGHMPSFYVDRLGQMMMPSDGRGGMRSFTDPAVVLGGGVRLDVSPRLSVRPDARALIVIANGSSYTVGVFSLGLGYRF